MSMCINEKIINYAEICSHWFVKVDKIQDSFDVINSKTKPLAAYLFSKDSKLEKLFVENVSAGGMCVNDTILHVSFLFTSYLYVF